MMINHQKFLFCQNLGKGFPMSLLTESMSFIHKFWLVVQMVYLLLTMMMFPSAAVTSSC